MRLSKKEELFSAALLAREWTHFEKSAEYLEREIIGISQRRRC
jgi:hypothetical protein